LPEVEFKFNAISETVRPENIALVMSNNMLGQFTLGALINKCILKGHIIFKTTKEGIAWLNAMHPIFINQYILE
jgi:hypothetical protein